MISRKEPVTVEEVESEYSDGYVEDREVHMEDVGASKPPTKLRVHRQVIHGRRDCLYWNRRWLECELL